MVRGVINSTGGESVAFLENFRRIECGEDLHDRSSVLAVRHTAAIVRLGDHVLQCCPRDLLEFVEELAELLPGNIVVGLRESVRDIPANCTKLPPVEDERMEEAEPEEELLEFFRPRAALEPVFLEAEVSADQGAAQTLRRFDRELDADLQSRDRERRRGHSSKPKAEEGMHFFRICSWCRRVGDGARQVLYHGLERRQPARRQMAVLQEHPLPDQFAFFHRSDRLRPLALAKADRLDLRDHVAPVGMLDRLREFEDVVHRIRATREHKDDRDVHSRVCERLRKVEWRNLKELLTELVRDDALESGYTLIRSECEHHQGFFEWSALHVEHVGPIDVEWCLVIKHVLPLPDAALEILDEAVKGIAKLLQILDAAPGHRRKPVRVLRLLLRMRPRKPGEQREHGCCVQLLVRFLYLEGEQERVEELVGPEKRPTDEVVQKADVGVEEVFKALVTAVSLLRLLDCDGKLDD